MRIHVLGPITIIDELGAEPSLSGSLRQLLAVLIAAGERGMLQDSIAEELWGEDLPATWESAFRNGVTRLRNKLGKSALEITSGRYHLNQALVQVDAWDMLRHATSPSELDSGLRDLLTGVPFHGVEITPTIRSMAEQIEVARTTLIQECIAHGRPPLDGASLSTLRSYQRRNAVDDNLLEIVVRAHLQAGETTRSLAILGEARSEAQADGRVIGSRLIALEEAVRRRSAPGPLLAQVAIKTPATSGRVPHALELALDTHQIGRQTELHQLLQGVATRSLVVILGQSGTGKTRLLAAAADHLAATGYQVRYAPGDSSNETAYGALLEAIPEATAEIRTALAGTTDQVVAQTKCNAILLDRLRAQGTGRACVLVDDGHLLDSHSERFIIFAASQTSVPVSIVVTARPDWASPGWGHFHQSLTSLAPSTATISPLKRLEVFELATHLHPTAGPRALMQLADDAVKATGGLPGVARYLIERADPDTLLLAGHGVTAEASNPLLHYANQFSDEVLYVGLGAAVLGRTFDLSKVAELVGLPIDETRALSSDLVAAEFVVEMAAPDRLVFSHALYRDALLARASQSKLRRLHRRAAGLIDDPRRQARHVAAAVPLMSEEDARDALVKASKKYFSDGSWRETAAALREAQRRSEGPLPIGDLCRFATALDLSGADGSLLREQAFAVCVEHDDWSAALAVATSGSQSAERMHGDLRRVNLLERVDADRLSDPQRFIMAAALVRQLTFLNRHDEASQWGQLAMAVAASPAERLMAFVHSALLGEPSESCEPLTVPFDFDEVEDKVIQLRGLQISVLSHLERSPEAVSKQLIDKMSRLTEAADDPYRTWHHAVLADALMFADGEILRACASAAQTRFLGDRYGIGDAEGAYLALYFFWRLCTGDVGLLRPDLERYRNAGESVVHHLMAAVIEASGSCPTEASGDALASTARAAAQSRSMFALPSLVLAAGPIARAVDPVTRDIVYNRLKVRTGTSALVANGVVHAGPVDRALAELAATEADAIGHRRRALEVADDQGFLLWRVQCRLDMGSSNDGQFLTEALQLADGTELMALVEAAMVS